MPLTQAQVELIVAEAETNPSVSIISDEHGWCVKIDNGNYHATVHPESFLEILLNPEMEDEPPLMFDLFLKIEKAKEE